MKKLYNLFFSGANFMTAILDGRGDGLVTEKLRGGVRMVRRAGTLDKFIIWEIWKLRGYDIPGFEIKPTDTVFDFGAQIGSFSVYAAKKARKGRVFSFEPFDESYRLLTANKKLNKLSNLRTFNYAISDRSGKAKFYLSHNNTGAHSLVSNDWTGRERHKIIKTISISDILKKHRLQRVSYLKMDIEGNEYKAILKTPKESLRKVEKIVMEYHVFPGKKHLPQVLKTYLEENGFSVRVRKPVPFRAGYMYATRVS